MGFWLFPLNTPSLRFTKHDQHLISLCLAYKVNLGLSLLKTVSVCIKPFVDNYNYGTGSVFTADETCIKIRNIKTNVLFIMATTKHFIIGYQITTGLIRASLQWEWLSCIWKKCLKPLNSLLMDTAHILSQPSSFSMNSVTVSDSISHRWLDWPMVMKYPKNSALTNRWLNGWTVLTRLHIVRPMVLITSKVPTMTLLSGLPVTTS